MRLSQVAMDLSDDELRGEDAIDVLVERVENYVNAFKEEEAKSLFRPGTRNVVVRCQQPNEPVTSFTRRRRWMVRVRLLADYLLDCNSISRDQMRLIQTMCMNITDVEMIVTASRKQHADIHKRESRSKHEEDRPRAHRTFTSSRSTSRPHFRTNPSRRAFNAAVDMEEDESPDDDGGDSESDSSACVSVLKENEFESVEDQIEQNVVCAFLSSGWDAQDESTAEECSTCVHDELFSFYTRQHAKDMGVAVDNHIHSFRPASEFQVEERRRKVQQAKEREKPVGAAVRGATGQGKTSVLLTRVVPKGKARLAKVPRTFDVQKYQSSADYHGNVCSIFSIYAGVQGQCRTKDGSNRCRSTHGYIT